MHYNIKKANLLLYSGVNMRTSSQIPVIPSQFAIETDFRQFLYE